MVFNLFDNWHVDWSFTKATKYSPSELTYILFMKDNNGCGRKNFILKNEILPDDRELIENRIKEKVSL